MIKILSSEQTRLLDQRTTEKEPIAPIDLMERASKAFVDWFETRYHPGLTVGIVCGTGNNGGDGLAIARLLHARQYSVKVWIIRGEMKETECFTQNLQRLPVIIPCKDLREPAEATEFDSVSILIDALLGTGLTRPAQGLYSEIIDRLNRSSAWRVAVDIPSGLFADRPSSGAIVKADETLTFQFPKLSFFLPESGAYVGHFSWVDIGLHPESIANANTNTWLTTESDIRSLLRPRPRFSHKGTYGHGLLIAGSTGKLGAAVISARACLRAGIGLLTIHLPGAGAHIAPVAIPEAMTSVDSSPEHFSELPSLSAFSALAIGPGLGQHPDTVTALARTLKYFRKPMVLDADALNILSDHPDLRKLIPPGSILTPHPGEFRRLVGTWTDDFEKLQLLRKLAAETACVIVLKGAFSAIATPDGSIYFNPTGNPGMATGGCGDALTGILLSLLSQGYPTTEAALIGVYVHGLAGDLAVEDKSQWGLIASDIVDFLPLAMKKISG